MKGYPKRTYLVEVDPEHGLPIDAGRSGVACCGTVPTDSHRWRYYCLFLERWLRLKVLHSAMHHAIGRFLQGSGPGLETPSSV